VACRDITDDGNAIALLDAHRKRIALAESMLRRQAVAEVDIATFLRAWVQTFDRRMGRLHLSTSAIEPAQFVLPLKVLHGRCPWVPAVALEEKWPGHVPGLLLIGTISSGERRIRFVPSTAVRRDRGERRAVTLQDYRSDWNPLGGYCRRLPDLGAETLQSPYRMHVASAATTLGLRRMYPRPGDRTRGRRAWGRNR
jgi:hypothetical protein